MKKRLLIMLSMTVMLVCLFAISVSAAASNEFGTVETIDGIDLTNMNTDTTSRVVIVDANGEYHTYPAQYVVSNNTKFKYDFTPIKNALGITYTKNSIVRIEVPDNITIAANCGDLSQTSNLIEIKFSPNSQLTTLEYGCFYANKKLEKLNIPKNITTIGTLIINNSSSLKELVFDDGFSAIPPKDSFIGATGLERVVFSNQMTTIDKKAFYNSFTNVKELYAGASLINFGEAAVVDGLGSDGGNFSHNDGPIKIYASSTLFADIDTIERGRLNGWTGNRLIKGVLFYTGTMEQAQALIDKAAADTPIFNKATLVEWDSTKADDEYVPSTGWNIVYNYNICKAFYNNTHAIDESKLTLEFNSYTDAFSEICACANGCGLEAVVNEYAPIFSGVKYSVKENGTALCASYSVNHKSLEIYNNYNSGAPISYGLVASSALNENETLLSIDDNGGVVTSKENAVLVGIDAKYAGFDFILRGFNEDGSQDNIALVISAYVTDGKNIYYISTSTNTAPIAITMSEAKNTTNNE